MKQKITLLVVLCALTALGISQCANANPSCSGAVTAAASTCTAGVCVSLPLNPNTGAVGVTVTGTFVATLQFEGSMDFGTTWVAINATPVPVSTAVTSATGVGVWQLSTGSVTNVRVRGSAYTSGTANVVFSTSLASAKQGGTPSTSPAWYPQTLAAGPYANYFDDFIGCTASGTTYPVGSAGIGAASGQTYSCPDAIGAQNVNHPGTFSISTGTGGAATGQDAFIAGGNNLYALNSSTVGWTYETDVYFSDLPGTTANSYQAGVAGTPLASPWTTGIGFYLSSANGVANDWYCRYSSTSTDSAVVSQVTTWTRLTIKSDATNVHWYINGTEVCGTGVAVASMPAGPFQMAWTNVAGTVTNTRLVVDYVAFQRSLTR